jgi:hypothetical protein
VLTDVTGFATSDWVATGLASLGVVLILHSLAVPGLDGPRRLHPLPAIAGVAVLVALAVFSLLRPDLPGRLVSSPTGLIFVVALGLISWAVVEFIFNRAVPAIRWILRRLRLPARATVHVAIAIALVPVVAAAAWVAWRTTFIAPITTGNLASSVEEFALPGDPLGIAMANERTGYVTLGQGSIVRFELPAGGGQISIRRVATGLEFPRGITIADNRLYVGELASLPCHPAYPSCFGEQIAPTSEQGERQIIKSARGRISSYAIGPTGELSDRRLLIGDLPVVDTLHSVNGLTIGPDGDLYVAIGAVDALWHEPSLEPGSTPHPEWLGTVLRVNRTTGDAQIFASGLRNVYGLTFDDRGDLWGVDNSGRAQNDRRAEEVLQIKQGRNYGYPADGTFGVWTQRTDHPVWVVDDVGSAGIRWAGKASMQPGLFLGSCGRLSYLRVNNVGGRWTVQNVAVDAVQGAPLLQVSGCVTDVQTLGPQEILASLYNFGSDGKLIRIRLSGNGG